MILAHYVLRTIKDRMNFIMGIAFPSVMILIMTMAANANTNGLNIIDGFNISATTNTTFNAIFFMFFGGMWVTDFLYLEFRSDLRWRLMAAPVPFRKFVLGAIGASMIITAMNTVVVLLFGRFILDAYLHNIFVTSATLILLAVFVTMFGVLCFLLIPKKSTTTAILLASAFVQLLPLQFGMISLDRGVISAGSFLPVGAAIQAVVHAGTMMLEFLGTGLADGVVRLEADMTTAFIHLGILAGYTALAAIAVAVVGRTRKI